MFILLKSLFVQIINWSMTTLCMKSVYDCQFQNTSKCYIVPNPAALNSLWLSTENTYQQTLR